MTKTSEIAAGPGNAAYYRFLHLLAGLGRLLYRINIGIIDPALGYLGKTISMTEVNKSVIVVGLRNNEKSRILDIAPLASDKENVGHSLQILRANAGPLPTKQTGILVAVCLALFITFFLIGPGVCAWLALSELMPMRIRSVGMGVPLLINQGVATGSSAFFLPIVGNYGYFAMFGFWAGCTVIYFITSAFFLPETKGSPLEEIEEHFAGNKSR